MNWNEQNPFAAPSPGAESPIGRRFVLSDELRQVMSSTATLMIVASVVQIIPTTLGLLRAGLSTETIVTAMLQGVIPIFVLLAGIALRGATSSEGGDLAALISGFRQLYVAFLIKGILLIMLVGIGVLGVLMMVLGVGRGLFNFFGG